MVEKRKKGTDAKTCAAPRAYLRAVLYTENDTGADGVPVFGTDVGAAAVVGYRNHVGTD